MIRVADYIMERINAEGVHHIFTVTGRGALFLSDAVAKHNGLKCISVHHEQAAAYSAVAYAQYNGKLGACLVSTGCAVTNALSGVLSAWQDGISCLFVSGQNTLNETSRHTGIPVRTYGQQEADVIPLVESITKYAVMITDPKRVVYELEKALYLAQSGRKGPVWLDVPLDVQSMRIDPDELEHFAPEEAVDYAPLPEDLEYVIKLLQNSIRPVILIGSGIHSAGAVEAFEAFVEKYDIPVTYTGTAPDAYGTDNELSIGSVGTMGCSRAGNFAVQNADLLLVIGSRLTSMTTGTDYCKFARESKVIVVDIDPVEHSKKSINVDRLIISDAKKFLTALMAAPIKKASQEWRNKCLHWKHLFPVFDGRYEATEKVDLYHLAESLSKTMPGKSIFVSDSGFVEIILPTNISFGKGKRCIHPALQGAMGYALPAAVGAHYASNYPVIAVIGDGSIMMNLQELQTIRYNNIPLKIFVINNNAYAIIRKRQVDLFRTRTIGTDSSNGVGCPDFRKIAASYDIPYIKIDNHIDLHKKIQSVIEVDGPVLCEIMGLEDQSYIETSHVRNSENRLVRRPIEDQAPFLDRKLFLSEMIIKPIDQ
jgi:acetolactate synthase-1/2/3 large subunit